MAKSTKKSDKPEGTEAKPKAAKKAPSKAEAAPQGVAKAAPKKAAERKPGVKPSLMGAGLMDSGLLASSAANFLLARAKGRHQMQSENTASISQIKSDLSKSSSAVAGELIDQHAQGTGGKRPNLPGGRGGSLGQTVGHAAERTSVPRRTGG